MDVEGGKWFSRLGGKGPIIIQAIKSHPKRIRKETGNIEREREREREEEGEVNVSSVIRTFVQDSGLSLLGIMNMSA